MLMFSLGCFDSNCFLQDMFQERAKMSSAHEANTQRLMSALRDKESALKVGNMEKKSKGSLFSKKLWCCRCRWEGGTRKFGFIN